MAWELNTCQPWFYSLVGEQIVQIKWNNINKTNKSLAISERTTQRSLDYRQINKPLTIAVTVSCLLFGLTNATFPIDCIHCYECLFKIKQLAFYSTMLIESSDRLFSCIINTQNIPPSRLATGNHVCENISRVYPHWPPDGVIEFSSTRDLFSSSRGFAAFR